jgi:uncharacterized protein YecE (DUF72 family)
MAKIFIGTSGWFYNWNKGKSLDWYILNSGLNSIELNMSFYRFPYPNIIKSWAKKGKSLTWVIKVHRSITHFNKMNYKSFKIFEKFKQIFQPLEEHIHYYLLQFPSNYKDLDKLEKFINKFDEKKIAIEFRNSLMFKNIVRDWAENLGVLLVSVDAPNLPNEMMSREVIYLRIHGKDQWYSYNYNKQELMYLKKKIVKYSPKRIYIFFNNNHAMLSNAQDMCKIFEGKNEEI